MARAQGGDKPVLRKTGTLDRDMVETTPFVFKGRLMRFEYVRENYWQNATGASYFQIRDVQTNALCAPFARGCHFGSAFCENDTVSVFGVTPAPSGVMKLYRSSDLERWEERTAFELPGWRIFNNSVCADAEGYVMAAEIDAPAEDCGKAFTMRFLRSNNLLDWSLTPPECVYSKDRYTACPAIRWLRQDRFYYMIYLEALPGWGFVPYIARSANLRDWARSPANPVLMFDEDDKIIANPYLPPAERERIRGALDINNSDVDLCEFLGRTVVTYSWGNQTGAEFLAEAWYEGPMDEFLQGFFREWQGGNPS